MIVFVFLTLFIALTAVYALFLFRVQQGLKWLQAERDSSDEELPSEEFPTVSVIVPVRNEARTIGRCIHSLTAQSYQRGKLQCIIVDDHSTDETMAIAKAAIGSDERFLLIQAERETAGKKAAITQAISRARGEIILTTDADCLHDARWVESMAAPFTRGADVVAGGVVIADRSRVFARLQALEFLGLVGVGAGLFGVGYPRLCNGANLAYRKSRFVEVDGFEGNDGIASGDDEFLMQKIVYLAGGNPAFATRQESVVSTPPMTTLRAFLLQRARWASKGLRYQDKRFVAFLIVLFVYFVFAFIAPFTVFFGLASFLVSLVLLFAKWTLEIRILMSTARLIKAPIRVADILIAEIVHPFYLVVVTVLGTIAPIQWKGRPLKHH